MYASADGEILGNPRRVRRFTREQYFKSAAQMQQLFADLPSALANTLEIARRCSLSLVLGKPHLPDFPIPLVDGRQMEPEEYFRHVSHQGLQVRLAHLYPDAAEREQQQRALCRAAGVRDEHHREDGFSRATS